MCPHLDIIMGDRYVIICESYKERFGGNITHKHSEGSWCESAEIFALHRWPIIPTLQNISLAILSQESDSPCNDR